jgi:hypothetical protein
MPSMIDVLMDDRNRHLAVAELLLGRVRGRQGVPLLDQARRTLDQAWTAIEQRSEAGVSLMNATNALEAAILERDRDDYTARAAAVVVYAVRSLTSRDERLSKYVWDVTEELLEDINEKAASPVALNAVRQAIPRVEPTELRRWAQARDILGLVRTLRPKTPASVRLIARAASRVRPDVQVPAQPVALADARRRALEAVGVAAFAKALEPLAVALPLGEVDARWQTTADRILAAVAGARISESDQRLLVGGFEAISPGGPA